MDIKISIILKDKNYGFSDLLDGRELNDQTKQEIIELIKEDIGYVFDQQIEVEQLFIPDVVVELPSKNSKEFKDWLKSEGYKNKGFGIYQKENKDYCYTLLYKHYCNVLEFGN